MKSPHICGPSRALARRCLVLAAIAATTAIVSTSAQAQIPPLQQCAIGRASDVRGQYIVVRNNNAAANVRVFRQSRDGAGWPTGSFVPVAPVWAKGCQFAGATYTPTGEAHVFFLTASGIGQIFHDRSRADDGWSVAATHPLPAGLISAVGPAVTEVGAPGYGYALVLYIVGNDGNLWTRWTVYGPSNWGHWTNLGPAVTSSFPGGISVFPWQQNNSFGTSVWMIADGVLKENSGNWNASWPWLRTWTIAGTPPNPKAAISAPWPDIISWYSGAERTRDSLSYRVAVADTTGYLASLAYYQKIGNAAPAWVSTSIGISGCSTSSELGGRIVARGTWGGIYDSDYGGEIPSSPIGAGWPVLAGGVIYTISDQGALAYWSGSVPRGWSYVFTY